MKSILPILILTLFTAFTSLKAQGLTFRKGIIADSVKVNEAAGENFALYLPRAFENSGKWPVMFVFDLHGRGKHAISQFVEAAEKENYILASSNNISDTLPVSQNILIATRMFNQVFAIFPIQKERVYTAGISAGGRMAGVIPAFLQQIAGVVSLGSGVPNIELLKTKDAFYFIGIVRKDDFNYLNMQEASETMDKMKYPNELLIPSDETLLPEKASLEKSMQLLTLDAMAKGITRKDTAYIDEIHKADLAKLSGLISKNLLLDAEAFVSQMIRVYGAHKDVESLKKQRKTFLKNSNYRSQLRGRTNNFYTEQLLRYDYEYNLTEDINSLNYDNLGWWKYQMEELATYEDKKTLSERQTGKRLQSYISALVTDYIDIEKAEATVDQQAVTYLWMLKTITDPTDYGYYLQIISESARIEDFGTALFYLEELLKNGYVDKDKLYVQPHTALLRITPEFNEIVDKYLKLSRYEIREE